MNSTNLLTIGILILISPFVVMVTGRIVTVTVIAILNFFTGLSRRKIDALKRRREDESSLKPFDVVNDMRAPTPPPFPRQTQELSLRKRGRTQGPFAMKANTATPF